MIWLCKNCGEENEFQFELCWNCNSGRGHSPPIDAGPPLNDPTFGDLYWDAESEWWTGFYPPNSELPFTLIVQTPSASDRSVSEQARAIFERICNDLDAVRRDAASEVLPDINKRLGESPVTLDEFLAVLVPEAITLHPEGHVEVGFMDGTEDDRFFGGHVLVSSFWPNGLREVSFEG